MLCCVTDCLRPPGWESPGYAMPEAGTETEKVLVLPLVSSVEISRGWARSTSTVRLRFLEWHGLLAPHHICPFSLGYHLCLYTWFLLFCGNSNNAFLTFHTNFLNTLLSYLLSKSHASSCFADRFSLIQESCHLPHLHIL